MAWYHQPVKPYDPVIEDQQDNQSTRYYQDDFSGAGQDSRTDPPAQNQAMWELLTNVSPITRGSLRRRRGYNIFGQAAQPASRLAPFQRDTDGLRTIVAISANTARAFNESGTIYNPQIFISKALPRMLMSRSYAYFFSSNSSDLIKWDGNPTTNLGLSNWGINFASTITNLTAGPRAGSSAASTAWTNPNNVLVSDGSFATVTLPNPNTTSGSVTIAGMGFSIPTNATILGITVEVQGKATSGDSNLLNRHFFQANLVKNGALVGNPETVIVANNNALDNFYTTGSSSDLWGTSWNANDINATGFGVAIQAVRSGPSAFSSTFSIDFIRITIQYLGATNAPTVSVGGAGGVTLTVGRIYYLVFANSGTGHFSDLSPASASTGPVTSKEIDLSQLAVSPDAQVDSKILLATADGGDPSELFYVATIPNATTTFADNTPETTLDLNQLYLFTDDFGNDFGVAGNTPPPGGGTVAVKHKGRLWMAVGQNLYYSKATTELTLPNGFVAGKYEESWPLDQYLDISEGAETVTGLLSNGQVLFIGTQRHVRWVTGDDPTNFSEPEVIHAEVGVLNQEVWQSVFIQGTPAGVAWLTPDFRVIMSDFNTYQDIGHEIQDVLGSINPAAALNSHATFVTDGEFDLYILAIPTGSNTACDTHCIFNMNTRKWTIWKPTDPSLALLFNVTSTGATQWLFSAFNDSEIFLYSDSATNDTATPSHIATAIPITARTSWLHLGSPKHRKLLDELEIIGDSAMQITIEGASPETNFNTPTVYKNAVTPVVGPFSQLKVFLASSGAKDRYYRLTFFVPGDTSADFLHSYNLKAIPFNTL